MLTFRIPLLFRAQFLREQETPIRRAEVNTGGERRFSSRLRL